MKELLTNLYKRIKKKIALPPIDNANNMKKFYTKKLTIEWRFIILIDIIIFLLAFTYVKQLGWVFGKGSPEISDWAKALAFALAEASFAKAASRAWVAKQSARPIWVALFAMMALTIPLNVIYEWSKSVPNPTFDSNMISKDGFVTTLSLLTSGVIGAIILGLSYIRMVQERIFRNLQQEFLEWQTAEEKRKNARDARARLAEKNNPVNKISETTREKRNQWQKDYRERKKKEALVGGVS